MNNMKEHETKPSFEERLKRLDEIARTIEQQTLPLEERLIVHILKVCLIH